MSTSQKLQSIKDQLDFLVERLNTQTLSDEERSHLLRRTRVLLVEMDTLAVSALTEKNPDTIELPL